MEEGNAERSHLINLLTGSTLLAAACALSPSCPRRDRRRPFASWPWTGTSTCSVTAVRYVLRVVAAAAGQGRVDAARHPAPFRVTFLRKSLCQRRDMRQDWQEGEFGKLF